MYNKQKVTVIYHFSARPRVKHNKITIFQTAFKLLYDKKSANCSYFCSNGSFRGLNFKVVMNRNTRETVEALFIIKFEIFFDLFLRYNTQL